MELRNRFQGIDSKKSIPPTFEVWRAGTRTLFLLCAWPPEIVQNFQHSPPYHTQSHVYYFIKTVPEDYQSLNFCFEITNLKYLICGYFRSPATLPLF
jgi:hypothetical protein